MNTLDMCYEQMKANKMVRMNPDRRKEFNDNIGQWFYIIAVHCDDTLTLCSNTHTILEGEDLNSIIIKLKTK